MQISANTEILSCPAKLSFCRTRFCTKVCAFDGVCKWLTLHSDQRRIAVAAAVLHRALVDLHVRGLLVRLGLLAVVLVVGERRVLEVRQKVDLLLLVKGLKVDIVR